MEATWDHAVVLHFWTFQECSSETIGRIFLSTLVKFGFVPNKFGDEDPPTHKFDMSSTNSLLKLWSERPGQLNLQRLGRMGFQALLHLSGRMPTLIAFAVHDEYFQSEENIAKFLELSGELYALLRPFHGDISHNKDRESKTVIITPIKIGNRTVNAETHIPAQPIKGLPGIFWANYLGPPFVDFYTKSKLEAAPAYSKKSLHDGGYLIMTSRSPLDYFKPETNSVETNLIAYLGPDTIFDKALPDRILRSPFPPPQNTTPNPAFIESTPPLSMSENLRNCPKCGESKNVEETSRESQNSLVGFKCQSCGERWLVHASLL